MSMSDEEMPFGENITNPESRTIPMPFHGQWSHNGEVEETIGPDRLTFSSGAEQVVAVRFIRNLVDKVSDIVMTANPEGQIAIVTRQADGEYALHYRGLSNDGARLVNLESADMVFDRC